MEISYDILPELLLFSFLLSTLYFTLYRRYLYAVIDPLLVFIVNAVFSSVLVLEVVEEPKYIIHFFICQLCLFLGFAMVQERTRGYRLTRDAKETPVFQDYQLLELTVYVLSVLYIISNLILFYTKGFALLTDSPTSYKVANFQQGFGIFRKINWSVGGVLSSGLIFLSLIQQRKRYMILMMFVVLFTAMEGSKSSLLRIILNAGLIFYHPAFHQNRALIRSYFKYIPIGVIGLFSVFFLVLLKENETPELAVFAFLRRLLYSADSVLYFYNPINQDFFSKYGPFDYPAYVLNPILGFFRIMPYNEAFGNIMVENTLPPAVNLDVIVGPNTSFYIEGQVFFGYIGAFMYSFLLGGLYGVIRWVYFSLVKCTAFLFVFLCYVCQLGTILFVDVNLFVTQLFDTCFFVVPTYIIVCFVKNKKIIIRRLQLASRIEAA